MEGHVVAVPTDTIYGLACLAQNSEAIRKIYDIKGRNQQKPLSICVGQIQDVYKWVFVHQYAGFCSRIFFFFFNFHEDQYFTQLCANSKHNKYLLCFELQLI